MDVTPQVSQGMWKPHSYPVNLCWELEHQRDGGEKSVPLILLCSPHPESASDLIPCCKATSAAQSAAFPAGIPPYPCLISSASWEDAGFHIIPS